MNDQAEKIIKQKTEGYSPSKPEIIDMAKTRAAEIIVSHDDPASPLKKLEIIQFPKLILAGISVRYSMQRQADGTNPPLWGLWDKFKKRGIMDILQAVPNGLYMDAPMGIYYDFNKDNDGCFSYAVGVLMKEDAAVPEEYMVRVMNPIRVACGWFKYQTGDDIFSVNPHGIVENFMQEHQITTPANPDDCWCAEVYHDELCEKGKECLCYQISCK